MPGFAKRVQTTAPPPWEAWTLRPRHARAVRFIQEYCAAPKGEGWGKPLVLAPFQQRMIREMFRPGVRSAVRSFPRGNGKSTFEAALAVWALFDTGSTGAPQVPIIATTVGQAIRSVYGVARSMVLANDELRSRALDFTGTGTSRISTPYNGGEMFPMANDVAGLQGLDPTLAIADEIGFQPIDAWDSLVLASGKRRNSLVIGFGTPGVDRDNALWYLRDRWEGGRLPKGFTFGEFAARPGCRIDDRRQWRRANPAIGAGFLAEDALELALDMVPEAEFRVFRLGQWVEGVESWLGDAGRETWDAGQRPYQLVDGAPTWIGVDVGIKRDSSAICAVQYRADMPTILHAAVKIWVPTKDEPVDVTDLMTHLRQLVTRYRVGAISYDPRFFDVPATFLFDEGLPMVEVPQSVEQMTPAVGGLYELIKGGGLTHDKDPLFAQQVLNAIPRLNERGFTLSKGKSRGRIDACIALALAVDRAQHKKKPRSPLVVL